MGGYMKRDNLEVYLGGVFGLVAIIAIMVELNMDGFVTKSLITGIKDISSLGVSFMLFVFTAKHLLPSLSFNKRFNGILSEWFIQMEPLVKKTSVQSKWSNFVPREFSGEEQKNYIRAFLSVDFNKYLIESKGGKDGEFLFLPEIKQKNYTYKEGSPVCIHFAMNRTTFLKNALIANSQDTSLVALGNQLCARFRSKFTTIECVCSEEKSDKDKAYIKLSIHQSFITDKEIRELFDMIDYMLFLYAIAA